MGAGVALCSLLINACEMQLGYSKPLIFLHDAVPVNVTCTVGANGSAPSSAPDQSPPFCKEPDTVLILNSMVCRLLDHCVFNLQTAA